MKSFRSVDVNNHVTRELFKFNENMRMESNPVYQSDGCVVVLEHTTCFICFFVIILSLGLCSPEMNITRPSCVQSFAISGSLPVQV